MEQEMADADAAPWKACPVVQLAARGNSGIIALWVVRKLSAMETALIQKMAVRMTAM